MSTTLWNIAMFKDESYSFIIYLVICLFCNVTASETLRPINERTCLPSYICINGYCNKPKIECICDIGWKGIFCSESECLYTCGSGTICGFLNGVYECLHQNSDSTGPLSSLERDILNRTYESTTELSASDNSVDKPTTELSASAHSVDKSTAPISLMSDNVVRQTNDFNTKFSLGFKTSDAPASGCTDSSVCVNGYCHIEEGRCICDMSFTGDRCQIKCPMACFPPKFCVLNNSKFSCEQLDIQIESTSRIERSVNVTTPPDIGSQTRNVCSDKYHMRSQNERVCPLTKFECTYGICTELISDDKFEMKCTCDPGSYGGKCEKACCLNCSGNGECRVNSTGYEYCDCYLAYLGRYCELQRPSPEPVKPEDTSWTKWVIGGSIAFVLFLFVIICAVLYCMWQHRVLMVMKLVHKFQPFEDGDDKDFDAFVSYRSSQIDEDFVYTRLYPKLEKEMGFKLCLHYRDFIPGDTIANNIIWAINNSRRTIIVLSPQYIRSDFTRFEYQVAQTEMLKRKHKIIPIVLEDVKSFEDEMDENLKVIIQSVTYIKWPGSNSLKALDQFWKQLQLSLPKKRKIFQQSTHSISSSSIHTFRLHSDKENLNNVIESPSNQSHEQKTIHLAVSEDFDSQKSCQLDMINYLEANVISNQINQREKYSLVACEDFYPNKDTDYDNKSLPVGEYSRTLGSCNEDDHCTGLRLNVTNNDNTDQDDIEVIC